MEGIELYKHQKDFISSSPEKHLLAWGTGTGKTASLIKGADKIKAKALIVVPKSLVDNWKREIKKWSDGNGNFTIITKEKFKKLYTTFKDMDALIIDEAHHFSGHKSQLHKAALDFIKINKIKYVWLATATPYRSTPFNIFALGNLLGRNWNWFKFNNTFFTMIKMGYRKFPKLKTLIGTIPVKEYIADIIKGLGTTVAMSDVVDIPDHVWLREDFVANREQLTALESLTDSTPLARLSKVFQILNGTLKSDGYIPDQEFKCDKFDRTIEILTEHNKIAVICRHTRELERFNEHLRSKCHRKVYILNGKTPQEDRDSIIQDFNNSDDCVMLIQAKVSEGYNLYTPVMVFYSMDWGLVEWTQMIGRPVRLDNLKSVIYINLIYKDTIDEAVYKSVVIEKQEFQAEIYKHRV